jgi:acetyltransferase-like isoleucine patch superfamily enzyme
MKAVLSKYWNLRLDGIPIALINVIFIVWRAFLNKINSSFWALALPNKPRGIIVQFGVKIRNPKNLLMGSHVSIAGGTIISTEIPESKLTIGSDVYINKNVILDYSGGLIIGDKVTISESVMIETHDHGYNPRSIPQGKKLIIEEKVWIGTRAIILPNVSFISKGSIIGAGAVVTKDILNPSIVAGNPARVIKHLDN